MCDDRLSFLTAEPKQMRAPLYNICKQKHKSTTSSECWKICWQLHASSIVIMTQYYELNIWFCGGKKNILSLFSVTQHTNTDSYGYFCG